MKIDTSKLKNLVKKPKGELISQCPACNAAGRDTTGNHLIVYPDGRFGCVANLKDKEHNKEILNLAGIDQPGDFLNRTVTVRSFKAPESKTLMKVPRRSLQQLGAKRIADLEMDVTR